MQLVPFLVEPVLDPKPWGGDGLRAFGLPVPEGVPIGEALITGSGARVASGPFAGKTLGEIVERDPAALLGPAGARVTGGRPIFPLLIKLIDAREDLSIQVHPNDQQAADGSLGKTEAWYILSAAPEAFIYAGLLPGVTRQDLAKLATTGESTAHLLRRLPARPGEVLFLPAGTVHALGAGVMIYEIQQPSAITYRLDDWGRVGLDGRPRELHIEQGLAVLDVDSHPKSRPAGDDPGPVTLVRCPYFQADSIVDEVSLASGDGPRVITCIEGGFTLESDDAMLRLGRGATAIVPPRCTAVLRAVLDASRAIVGSVPT